jgi:eight-cysteine-cluster-containing protein
MARISYVGVLCLALATASCGRTPQDVLGASAPAASASDAYPRQPYFTPGSESYAYYEGSSVRNGCTQDQNCLISGCSGSTCAAEAVEITDNGFCQEREFAQSPEPALARCGCLNGECRWYFEDDYNRHCDVDSDCAGLGLPRGGIQTKARWECVDSNCQYLDR